MLNPNTEIHRGWNRRVVTGKTLAECDERLVKYLNDQDYGSGEFAEFIAKCSVCYRCFSGNCYRVLDL